MGSGKMLRVWIGIILLSGMFLLGHEPWQPPQECPELWTGAPPSTPLYHVQLMDCEDLSEVFFGTIGFLDSTVAEVDLVLAGYVGGPVRVTYSTRCEEGERIVTITDDACFEGATGTPGVIVKGCLTFTFLRCEESEWPGLVDAFTGWATYWVCLYDEGNPIPLECPRVCSLEDRAVLTGHLF